jgi:hypothetical protein
MTVFKCQLKIPKRKLVLVPSNLSHSLPPLVFTFYLDAFIGTKIRFNENEFSSFGSLISTNVAATAEASKNLMQISTLLNGETAEMKSRQQEGIQASVSASQMQVESNTPLETVKEEPAATKEETKRKYEEKNVANATNIRGESINSKKKSKKQDKTAVTVAPFEYSSVKTEKSQDNQQSAEAGKASSTPSASFNPYSKIEENSALKKRDRSLPTKPKAGNRSMTFRNKQ